jgi:hypothetical protein
MKWEFNFDARFNNYSFSKFHKTLSEHDMGTFNLFMHEP